MSEKQILPISNEAEIEKCIGYLYNNRISIDFITECYSKRKFKPKQKPAQCLKKEVDWTQGGIYFLDVHHSKPFTPLHIEEPNGSIVELYKENGDQSKDLISAIHAGVADAPEGKELFVISGLNHIIADVNNLLAIKANGWIRPKSKTAPSHVVEWALLADTIEEKKITLRAGKARADFLQIADKNASEAGELKGGVNVA